MEHERAIEGGVDRGNRRVVRRVFCVLGIIEVSRERHTREDREHDKDRDQFDQGESPPASAHAHQEACRFDAFLRKPK